MGVDKRGESFVAETELRNEVERLREDFQTAMRQLDVEDVGWSLVFGTGQAMDKLSGPTLDQAKKVVERTRTYSAGHALVRHAVDLRGGYVFSKGLIIPNLRDKSKSRSQGRPAKLDVFVENPVNQNYLFGGEAGHALEASLATDGCYLVIIDSKREARPMPITEVIAVQTHPDFRDEIWAYLREWSSYDPQKGEETTKREWIYTDFFTGTLPQTIKRGSEKDDVAQNKRIVDLWVNRQTGWTFGVADTLPAIPWAQMYTEVVVKGKTVTDALAAMTAKVKVKSQAGSDKVGARVSRNTGAGSIMTYGEGNDIDVFSSAGKGYDFEKARPIAAFIAAALGVSIVHLLSDPGAAGSSYGSASNLDLPQKRVMEMRQKQWASFFSRILKHVTGEDIEVTFPPTNDNDPYRDMQSVTMGWLQGAFHPEEYRKYVIELLRLDPIKDSVPEGILIPNNAASLARRDIDTDSKSPNSATTASPDQGQSNGTGGAGSTASNDQRTDLIGEMMRNSSNEEFLVRFENLIERFERANSNL